MKPTTKKVECETISIKTAIVVGGRRYIQKIQVAGFEKIKDKIFAIQFHPEKGILGNLVFQNFFNICKKNG